MAWGNSNSNERSKVKTGIITLTASDWVGDVEPYYQKINSFPIGVNTQIDLIPNMAAMSDMNMDNVDMIYIQNENGVASAVAIGGKPTVDLKIQANFTEVNPI